jgi:hypothetical protein
MRTDPRTACANDEERTFWAFVHDAVSHPLMALSGWSKWSLAFHDWTSHRAWPRTAEPTPRVVAFVDSPTLGYAYRLENRHGIFWTADAGHRQYSFVADDYAEAIWIAEKEWATQEAFEREQA